MRDVSIHQIVYDTYDVCHLVEIGIKGTDKRKQKVQDSSYET